MKRNLARTSIILWLAWLFVATMTASASGRHLFTYTQGYESGYDEVFLAFGVGGATIVAIVAQAVIALRRFASTAREWHAGKTILISAVCVFLLFVLTMTISTPRGTSTYGPEGVTHFKANVAEFILWGLGAGLWCACIVVPVTLAWLAFDGREKRKT